MDIKFWKNNTKKNKKLYLGFLTVFILLGVGVYYLPDKYLATGSFLIQRTPEPSTNFFTYEGYYAQQTAQLFTNTAIGILESTDLLAISLEKTGVSVNPTSIRKYGRATKVTKTGPQLITFTVKGNSPDRAERLWTVMANELIHKGSEINAGADKNLKILQVYNKPLVSKAYKSLCLNILAGIFAGMAASLLYVSYKNYD